MKVPRSLLRRMFVLKLTKKQPPEMGVFGEIMNLEEWKEVSKGVTVELMQTFVIVSILAIIVLSIRSYPIYSSIVLVSLFVTFLAAPFIISYFREKK